MILRRYKTLSLVIVIMTIFLPSLSLADGLDDYNIWYYRIDEGSGIVDVDNTTADVDYEERVIKLPKLPASDVIKFTSDTVYDYVVLEEDGFQHYAFNGDKMMAINSLSKKIDDPLGIAVNTENPSYFISELDEDGAIIRNYAHTEEGMIDNPILGVTGLDYIYSLSTFETGELAVLTEDALKTYTFDGKKLIELPALSRDGIKDPLAVATSNDFQIAILTKEKVEHYIFNGDSLSNIPMFDIAITKEDFKKPKAIVIDDDKTFILDEKEVKTYVLKEEGMTYNAAFSISSNLERPQAIAFNRGTKDIIIVDENKDKEFIAKYFMFNGEEYVENKHLSQEVGKLAVGDRYYEEAEFITDILTTQSPYFDLIRIQAFTETPESTEIEFFVTYDVEIDGEEVSDWISVWKVVNDNNQDSSKGDVSMGGERLGDNSFAYPTHQYEVPEDGESYKIKDEDITMGSDGRPIINTGKNYSRELWSKIDIGDRKDAKENGRYKDFRIKAVLKTSNPEITPKIFAPIGTNNEKNIVESDEIALKIEVNAEPLPPDVIIKDPSKENPLDSPMFPGFPDMPNRPIFDPIDGWVYTTTPNVYWEFNDVDTDGNPMERQIAYQLILLADDGSSWKIAYDTGRMGGERGRDNSLTIPTTFDNPEKGGPLWRSGAYTFIVGVRTWDIKGAVSDFNIENLFKVLAFERPRIANVVNSVEHTSEDEVNGDVSKIPKLDELESHKMILPDMSKGSLPVAKAGAQVTLLLDSVGPITTPIRDIPLFYVTLDGKNVPIFLSDCDFTTNGQNKTWEFNFFTNAPIETIPEDTVVKATFVGESKNGGTTVLYIPSFADGVINTGDTIYKDWQVIIEGRDRD